MIQAEGETRAIRNGKKAVVQKEGETIAVNAETARIVDKGKHVEFYNFYKSYAKDNNTAWLDSIPKV